MLNLEARNQNLSDPNPNRYNARCPYLMNSLEQTFFFEADC